MIGTDTPSRAEMAASLASGVRTLDGLIVVLQEQLTAARKLLRASEDPKSLDLLAARATQARGSAASADALLAKDQLGPAALEINVLTAGATTGIAHRELRDDIETMLDQSRAEGTKKHKLTEALVALDRQIEQIEACAGDLAETATAVLQTILDGETIMDKNDNTTASAVRDGFSAVVNLIGAQYPAAAPQSRPAVGRRFEAVGDQMMATLDGYGLPHDGVQLLGIDDADSARARLIDGLTRNFDFRDKDGFRVFYRSVPQPAQRDTSADSRLLRGAMLVNANLLRAEADAVLDALDRMPGMLRFVPTQSRGIADGRARVRENLDQLVAIARDPMGVPTQRAEFQMRRLVLAVADYLDRGEIITSRSRYTDRRSLLSFKALVDEQLRIDEGTVRDEELRVELRSLRALLGTMHARVTSANADEQRGRAAARLEEALSAAYDSAGMLEQELVRAGSSIAEQDVQFFAADDATTEAGPMGAGTVSIGQFARWLRGVAEPFVLVENRSAMLRLDELENLADELEALARAASALQSAGSNRRLGVGLPGPYRQLAELEGLIATAAERAKELTNPDGATEC
jgi:hypothetical protein